jgi:hypothetical protein
LNESKIVQTSRFLSNYVLESNQNFFKREKERKRKRETETETETERARDWMSLFSVIHSFLIKSKNTLYIRVFGEYQSQTKVSVSE